MTSSRGARLHLSDREISWNLHNFQNIFRMISDHFVDVSAYLRTFPKLPGYFKKFLVLSASDLNNLSSEVEHMSQYDTSTFHHFRSYCDIAVNSYNMDETVPGPGSRSRVVDFVGAGCWGNLRRDARNLEWGGDGEG
jgi:hypothetical protein